MSLWLDKLLGWIRSAVISATVWVKSRLCVQDVKVPGIKVSKLPIPSATCSKEPTEFQVFEAVPPTGYSLDSRTLPAEGPDSIPPQCLSAGAWAKYVEEDPLGIRYLITVYLDGSHKMVDYYYSSEYLHKVGELPIDSMPGRYAWAGKYSN